MKNKTSQLILICSVLCLLLCNTSLLLLHQIGKNELIRLKHELEHLESVEFMFDISKEITVSRFRYEQYQIGDVFIYTGSENNTLLPLRSLTNQPKLVLGLNQNMCRPCVEGVFADIKEFFPNFETNPNIICIADIEQRFKDNYFGKKVVSFHQKEKFPLYEIVLSPYLFILDKDLCVKLLFITDKASPELTSEYLKIIKERYPDI